MDITSILQGIKGKVLDAAHFDLLKHAYELQEENINQLKSNNEALKESNVLIRGKLQKAELEKAALEEALASAKAEADKLRPRDAGAYSLSVAAKAVLALFKAADVTDMYEANIVQGAKHSRIEVESAIEELSSANFLDYSSVSPQRGVNYYLTAEGKRYVLSEF